jgi:hypothetical protein
MKIVKFLIYLGVFLVIAEIIHAHKTRKLKMKHKMKSKSRVREYDTSYSPGVIREFLLTNIDATKDDKKLLNSCLNQFTENARIEPARKNIWAILERFAANYKPKLTSSEIKDFLSQLKLETKIQDGEASLPVDCSDYVTGIMLADTVIDNNEHTDKLRNQLHAAMGMWQGEVKKRNNKLVSSFASYYRDSSLRHPELFKRLNENKTG